MGSLTRIGIKLTYFAVLIAPIFGLYQYFGCFPQININFTMPWYYKGAKDILLILVYVFFMGSILSRVKFKISYLLSLFFIFLFFYILMNLVFLDSYLLTLVGIRSLLTLLFAFFSYSFFSEREIKDIAKCVVFTALLMLPLSIIQFLFGLHIHGTMFGKFAARVAATFVQPSSLGIFLVLAVYFVKHYSFKYEKLLLSIFAVNILLTGSGIAILGFVFIIVISMANRKITSSSKTLLLPFLVLLLPVSILFTAIYLPEMTDRPDIFISGQGRIEVVKNYFSDNLTTKDIFLGKGFGYGTNSLYTIFPDIGEQYGFIPDSMFISMIAQIGVLGLLFFLFINAYAYVKSKNPIKYIIPLCLFCGLTVNILELYPVNWIYPILLGFLLKKDSPITIAVQSVNAENQAGNRESDFRKQTVAGLIE